MLQRLVDQFARGLTRRPGFVLAALVVVIVLAVLSVRQLRFSTDLFAMAPPDARIVQSFRQASEEFGGTLFVVVHDAEGSEPNLPAAVQATTEALRASDLFSSVRGELTEADLDRVREQLRGHVFAYRSEAEEPRLSEMLDPESITARLGQVKGLLLTPFVSQAAVLSAADPLRSQKFNLQSGSSISLKPGPILSEDGNTALIITQPKEYPQNVDFAQKIVETLNKIDVTMRAHPEHPAQVSGFGAHVTVLQYGGQLKDDIAPAAISSVIGCSLFFFLLYRSWSIVWFTALALGAGVLISLGLMAQVIGVISPFTVGISALLVGTGIDHAIHFFNRYIEEREAGAEEPVRAAISGVGVAVVLAALTTGGAFLFMLTSSFTGIRDYGLSGASGVAILLVTVLVAVPGLVQLRVKLRDKHSGRSLRIEFPSVSRKRAAWALVAVVFTILVLSPFALRPHFDMDINSFRIPDPTYVAQRNELMGRFGLSGKTAVSWLIHGNDLDALLTLNDQVTEVVEHNRGGDRPLSNYDSLSNLLPGKLKQQARLDKLDAARVDAALTTLNGRCDELGLTDQVCEPLRGILKGAQARDLVTYQSMMDADLGDLLLPYLRKTSDGGYVIAGRMWSGSDEMDGAIPEDLALKIEAIDDRITVAGPVRGNEELTRFFHKDLAWVCAFAGVGIVLMLLLQYRHQPIYILLTLAPVATGLFGFIGLATVMGFTFGVLSLVILPLVVGVGIDSGIHLTHHLHTDRHLSIGEILTTTGRALIASSFTTAIGCAANMLTSNPQVQDMGLLCAMGVLCCMVSSLVVWPSLAALVFPRRASPVNE